MNAGRFTVREARREDAEALSRSLRAADLNEILASTPETPCEVLERGVATSRPCYGVVDALDRPVALFGVVPDGCNSGLIWLLGSDELALARVSMFRRGLALIDDLQRAYPVLHNGVDVRNAQHLDWLLWCGFRVVGSNDHYGVEGRHFLQVRRERSPGASLAKGHVLENVS